jgi:hypothetical protein
LSLFCQHPLVVYYIRMVVKTEVCYSLSAHINSLQQIVN